MSIQEKFIFKGGRFHCEMCEESTGVEMPVAIDLFMLMSQAFQIHHLKKCFGENGPYEDTQVLMEKFYEERMEG